MSLFVLPFVSSDKELNHRLEYRKATKVYSKDIWAPAAVTQGLSKDTFSKLTDHDGVTTSEFAMIDMITRKIEEFIGRSDVVIGKEHDG